MKSILSIFLCINTLAFGMQAYMARSNSISPHQKPITAMTDKQALIDETNKIIASSRHDLEQRQWLLANLYLKNGLAALGDRYISHNTIDDSGMKLIVADDLERKGELERAARLRLKILQERLDQFKANP
jgi:hypothetical protein